MRKSVTANCTSRAPSSEEQKNEIWTAIKTIPTWKNDIVADIKVTGGGSGGGARPQRATYTVKAGDTLSEIAKEHLGDANAYMKIFKANKDQLSRSRTRSSRDRS